MRWFWRWLMIRARGWELVRVDGNIVIIAHREMSENAVNHLRDALMRMTPAELEQAQP